MCPYTGLAATPKSKREREGEGEIVREGLRVGERLRKRLSVGERCNAPISRVQRRYYDVYT